MAAGRRPFPPRNPQRASNSTSRPMSPTPPGSFAGPGGPPSCRPSAATATALGQGKMSSRVAADFRTDEGPVFGLDADVLPHWTIDSVESQPADALDDWTLENRGGARLVHPSDAPPDRRSATAVDRFGAATLCFSRPQPGHRRRRAAALCRAGRSRGGWSISAPAAPNELRVTAGRASAWRCGRQGT